VLLGKTWKAICWISGSLYWWRRICWPFHVIGSFSNPGSKWFMLIYLSNIYRGVLFGSGLGAREPEICWTCQRLWESRGPCTQQINIEVTRKEVLHHKCSRELRVSYPRRQGKEHPLWAVTPLLPGEVFSVLRDPFVLCLQGSVKSTRNTCHKVSGWGNFVMWPVLSQLPPLGTSFFSLIF